jgi:hypothetical protein
MNDDRLEGLIDVKNAAALSRMLDIYSLNTLVTFLIELELAPPGERRILPEPEPEPTIEEQSLKAYAFDLSRATNLYLVEARALGRALDGNMLSDLLFKRTGWNMSVCNDWAERVLNDDQVTAVLLTEGIE